MERVLKVKSKSNPKNWRVPRARRFSKVEKSERREIKLRNKIKKKRLHNNRKSLFLLERRMGIFSKRILKGRVKR